MRVSSRSAAWCLGIATAAMANNARALEFDASFLDRDFEAVLNQ